LALVVTNIWRSLSAYGPLACSVLACRSAGCPAVAVGVEQTELRMEVGRGEGTLATAEMHDGAARGEQETADRRPGSEHRHDVRDGRQDEAQGDQDFEDAEGLDD
jgi:hypothetical protein